MSTHIFRRLLFAAICLATFSGCFSLSVRKNVQGLAAVERRQQIFLFGFFGDPVIDLSKECPQGAARFEEVFTPADILYTIVSVGIYTPRTVRIECEAKLQ